MLIQALAAYADSRLRKQMDEPAFETKPLPYLLEIGVDGHFTGVIAQQETVTRGKKSKTVERPCEVPKSPVNRNSGLHPLLCCDDVKYVLGPGPWTEAKDRENHEERHDAFVKLIREASASTSDEGLAAASRFYDWPDQVEAAIRGLSEAGAKTGSLVGLSMGGALIGRPAVRQYWCDHYSRAFQERSDKGGEGMCLVTGRVGAIAPTHDKIKGTAGLGGQPSGVALMSFDKDAFRSYGWEQNANSPVSPERAQAYVLALNDLLANKNGTRVNHGDTAFLFWTRRPADTDPMALLEQADPEQVARVLRLQAEELAGHASNDFHLLGVGANGSRLLVRHWIHDSLDAVLGNVKSWFEGLRMVDSFSGEIASAPPMWRILKAIARDEPPADRILQLYRRGLHGSPLGRTILAAALRRLQVPSDDRPNPVRVGLIRLAVNDLTTAKGAPMSESLDTAQSHPAYLCGRLLALYDGLQYTAQGDINVTVADRYFGLASTHPALAFPKIAVLGKKHLAKVRRDNRGAAYRIEEDIASAMSELTSFPRALSLEDQGRFAIGYHHQRAAAIKGAKDAKARKASEKEGANS